MKLSPEEIVAAVVATSFAAGLNVYATVATLGLLARLGVWHCRLPWNSCQLVGYRNQRGAFRH